MVGITSIWIEVDELLSIKFSVDEFSNKHNNNDRFDPGSYSLQQPITSEKRWEFYSQTQDRTTRTVLPTDRYYLAVGRPRYQHSSGRRHSLNCVYQIQGTNSSTQANDKYLWQALSHSSKASFKDMVLGTMIDKEKSIRRAAANVFFSLFR